MEYVAFTTTQLQYLGDRDEQLAPYFVEVFAADELPSSPRRDIPQAYIVNTDPRTKPGTHWIALPFTLKRDDVKSWTVMVYRTPTMTLRLKDGLTVIGGM